MESLDVFMDLMTMDRMGGRFNEKSDKSTNSSGCSDMVISDKEQE